MPSDNPLFIAVVIPALNEAGNIRSLVQDVRQIVPAHIIVADNGSTDDTAGEAQAAGAIVVSEPRRGYGYACAGRGDEGRRAERRRRGVPGRRP